MNTDLNPNPLVRFLGKPQREFTKADLVRYVRENGIEMINFRYPGADGRLKTLNFVIQDEEYLASILSCGERVDGSSLFPYIEAGASDLYVVPRYRTASATPSARFPPLTSCAATTPRRARRWRWLPSRRCARPAACCAKRGIALFS